MINTNLKMVFTIKVRTIFSYIIFLINLTKTLVYSKFMCYNSSQIKVIIYKQKG